MSWVQLQQAIIIYSSGQFAPCFLVEYFTVRYLQSLRSDLGFACVIFISDAVVGFYQRLEDSDLYAFCEFAFVGNETETNKIYSKFFA